MGKIYTMLTATTHDRREFLNRMLDILTPQLNAEVEHIILTDGGEMTLGRKMNLLYGMASGKYVAALNDDDIIPPNYIQLILDAAKSDADILLGKLKSGWVSGLEGIDQMGSAQIIHRYENVIPAKTELVRKYTVWDESRAKSYTQDSDLASHVYANAKNVHIMDDILYYHMRQKVATPSHERSRGQG